MNWLRDTLKKHRVFVLAFLLVETFYWAEGLQFVYAHEIREQEREVHFQRLSELLGIPVEKLRGETWSLFGPLEELAEDVSSSVGAALDDLSSTLRRQTRRAKSEVSRLTGRLDELLETPDATPVASAEPAAFLGAPQETDEPESARLRTIPRAAAVTLDTPRERTGRASRSEPKALPLRQVERKARTEKARSTARSVQSSAVAPASVPRQVLPKDGVAPEIAALAASLDNSPADIFRFVHDQIDFDPKWGAEKSPLGTLYERQGTSWDQAWLLQQLLTAAGVDARLEWGEIEIPADMLKNITGVEDPWRAGDLMTTAGTPIVLVVEGSQVKTARMSHVWVKAYLDYIPNRGVTPGPGDTWIRMDPSLKRFAIAGELRLDAAVPYDLGEYLESGTELSPRQFYEAALDAYVTANHPEVSSLEELKRTKGVVEEAFPFVPGTLRGKILSVQGESMEVPDAFQQKLKLEVREAGGSVLATYETAWPAVYGQRLELAWPGATSSDQATLDLYGGVFSTPPFEVDLKPSIRVEGVEVAAGSAIGSAEDVVVQATWTTPQGLETVVPFEMWAGEPGVLSADFGRTPQETIDRYMQALSAATDPAEQEVWRLALAGARYQRSLGGDLAHLADLRWQRVLNLGRIVLAVQRGAVSVSPDGTPLTFSRGPTALDLGSMPLGLFPAEGGAVSTVPTMELLGSQGSFLEGEALGQVFEGEHVTGVTFLTRAVREGQTLTRVDAANVDEALGAAELSAEAEANVRAAVENGVVAWIPESQLPVDTFDATGYVVEDPATGAAGYFVTYERLVQGLDANIVFHSPQDLEVVTEPVDIVATIESEALKSWTLSYQMVGEGPAVVLATGEGSVTEATLAQFDPTLLLNGLYDIVLTGRDVAGQSASEQISVNVEGKMKVGNFTLSFLDLAIPLAGLDIEVVRTYDSRQRRSQGDFGYGWTLDIRHGSYRHNRPPGQGWQIVEGFLPCEEVIETRSHATTVRLSDTEVYRFRAELYDGKPTLGGCFATARFSYVGGPSPATLEILGNAEVFFENGGNRVIDAESLEVFDPPSVRLTTRDGRIFHVNDEAGVTLVKDRNGNELVITDDDITHSSGKSIYFEHDTDGRIVRITDPAGVDQTYTYDDSGDLVEHLDREQKPTRFTYDEHYLVSFENALGIEPVRSDYDDDGRLIRQTDAFGKAIEFNHEVDNRREVVKDRLGHSAVLEYNDDGDLVKEINFAGGETLYEYGPNGHLTSVTLPDGAKYPVTFDVTGDLTELKLPSGEATKLTYDGAGRLLTYTDAEGQVTSRTYDSAGNLIQVEDPLGTTTYTYNSRGDVTSVEAPASGRLEFAYDGAGNLIERTDALGHKASYEYDANNNKTVEQTTRTLPSGAVETLTTRWVYDRLDRVEKVIYPDGSTQEIGYSDIGQMTSFVNELGEQVDLSYDIMGRRVKVTRGGLETTLTQDAEGRVSGLTDPSGATVSYARNPNGLVDHIGFSDGDSLDFTLDPLGRILSVRDENGKLRQSTYDLNGFRTSDQDALGRTITYTYDALGRRKTATGPDGTMAYEYDAHGRRTSVTLPDGSVQRAEYDAAGRLTAETDPAGRTTRYEYDLAGRPLKVIDALQHETTYTYDELGNLTSVLDAEGRLTRFAYDRRGRLIEKTLPLGQKETYVYDVAGRLVQRSDYNGNTTAYEYDALGQMVKITYDDATTSVFTYTDGALTGVTDSNGTWSYQFDDKYRLTDFVYPDGRQVNHLYDDENHKVTVNAASRSTSYAFDDVNRVTSITSADGTVQYEYDPSSGRRTAMVRPNGTRTEYQYDTLGRLEGLTHLRSDASVISSYTYDYNAVGYLRGVTDHDGRRVEYAYDDVNQLIEEKVIDPVAGTSTVSYTYDAAGNRLSMSAGGNETTYTYDDNDRLLTAGTASYGFDNNGNLTSRQANGEQTTYTWDLQGRLAGVVTDTGSGTPQEVAYTYDPEGLLSERVANGSETSRFSFDHTQPFPHLLAETDEGGQLVAAYTHGDRPVSMTRDSTTSYYHQDGGLSVRQLTDANETVTDEYTYDPFGSLRDTSGTTPNPFRYAGEQVDDATGLYNLRARHYDPGTGRFLSHDPVQGNPADPISLHRYLYARNNPVNYVDPSGRQGFGVAGWSAAMAAFAIVGLSAISLGFARGFGSGGDENGWSPDAGIYGASVFMTGGASFRLSMLILKLEIYKVLGQYLTTVGFDMIMDLVLVGLGGFGGPLGGKFGIERMFTATSKEVADYFYGGPELSLTHLSMFPKIDLSVYSATVWKVNKWQDYQGPFVTASLGYGLLTFGFFFSPLDPEQFGVSVGVSLSFPPSESVSTSGSIGLVYYWGEPVESPGPAYFAMALLASQPTPNGVILMLKYYGWIHN